MLTVMDDIYDAYGTFEELEHLTEAVKRSIGFLHIDFPGLECSSLDPFIVRTFQSALVGRYVDCC